MGSGKPFRAACRGPPFSFSLSNDQFLSTSNMVLREIEFIFIGCRSITFLHSPYSDRALGYFHSRDIYEPNTNVVMQSEVVLLIYFALDILSTMVSKLRSRVLWRYFLIKCIDPITTPSMHRRNNCCPEVFWCLHTPYSCLRYTCICMLQY